MPWPNMGGIDLSFDVAAASLTGSSLIGNLARAGAGADGGNGEGGTVALRG